MSSETAHSHTAEAKDRLRADLKIAMRARDAVRTRIMRALIAVLDNAEAVPPGDRHTRYRSVPLGEAGRKSRA